MGMAIVVIVLGLFFWRISKRSKHDEGETCRHERDEDDALDFIMMDDLTHHREQDPDDHH